MSEEVKVRVGVPEDLHACMDLFLKANEENGLAKMDENKLINMVWPSLHCDGGMVGVIGSVGKPLEGVVLLRIEELWYTQEPVIAEKLVFVHPDYRNAKGGRAAKLCEFAKRVSDEMQMPLIIGVISNTRTESKIKMYKRLIGEPAGAFFVYGGKTGQFAKEKAA